VNDAVEALQAKVGVDSSAVTTSLDYKVAQLEAISHGKILQVVSTTKTDTFSAAISATWTDVTGLNLSITPTSATSKVLVTVHCPVISNTTNGGQTFLRVTRDGTAIGVGDAAGSRTQIGFGHIVGSSDRDGGTSFQFLDSPASTSALDYQVEVWSLSYTVLINRYSSDANANTYARSSCTITAMEVSA
jgi:hypothetical protein